MVDALHDRAGDAYRGCDVVWAFPLMMCNIARDLDTRVAPYGALGAVAGHLTGGVDGRALTGRTFTHPHQHSTHHGRLLHCVSVPQDDPRDDPPLRAPALG